MPAIVLVMGKKEGYNKMSKKTHFVTAPYPLFFPCPIDEVHTRMVGVQKFSIFLLSLDNKQEYFLIFHKTCAIYTAYCIGSGFASSQKTLQFFSDFLHWVSSLSQLLCCSIWITSHQSKPRSPCWQLLKIPFLPWPCRFLLLSWHDIYDNHRISLGFWLSL